MKRKKIFTKGINSVEGKAKMLPLNARVQGIKYLALNTLVPLFLVILLILIVNTTVKMQIYKYGDDSASIAAQKLSTEQLLSVEDCEKQYATKFLVGYLDESKKLICTADYGNSELFNSSQVVKDMVFKEKYDCQITLDDTSYAASIVKTVGENEINAKYVLVLFDMTSIYKIVFSQIMVLVCIMFVIIFFVQILVAIFATKIQIRPYVQQLEKNQQLVADISHEFNTPLAIVNAKISNIVANPQAKSNDLAEDLLIVLDEINRLKRMVKDMLFLSKSDRAIMILEKTECDISEKISSIVEPFELQCEAEGKQFVADIQPNLVLDTDGDKIRQTAIIFMDNALKYTLPKDKIILKLEEKNGKIILSVADTGIGVDDAQMEKVFERFYRVDEARTDSKIGGTGLGLSIAKAIAINLGGKLTASHNIPNGFKIQLELKSSM